jgi:diguanylate cyclase (GGDEF)-like protein
VICRIGGDEFVVIMLRVNSSMTDMVCEKVAKMREELTSGHGGLPKITLSVGVAFSDRKNPAGDIFKDADTALYRMKEGGRCGCVIY